MCLSQENEKDSKKEEEGKAGKEEEPTKLVTLTESLNTWGQG